MGGRRLPGSPGGMRWLQTRRTGPGVTPGRLPRRQQQLLQQLHRGLGAGGMSWLRGDWTSWLRGDWTSWLRGDWTSWLRAIPTVADSEIIVMILNVVASTFLIAPV